MIRRTAGIAALVAASVAGLPAHAGDGALPSAEATARDVDRYLTPLVESGLFSGVVLLARGGKVVVEKAYGPADIAAKVAVSTSTRFKLMSVTKAITAVAVLRLSQEGRLDVEDPVKKHLDGWPAGWSDVTVHQLLDHTSGIANLELSWTTAAGKDAERGLAVWRRLAPSLAAHSLDAPPGTRFQYSNFNYVLLGLVVESASGKPYPEAMRAAVLEPAGMRETGFDDGGRKPGLSLGYFRGKDGVPEPRGQDMSVIQGAGGIYAAAGDLYRLDRALQGDALLTAATKRKMLSVSPRGGYALGWQVGRLHDRLCVQHSGGANGYVADFLRFPDDDACVVVLSNFAYAPILRLGHDLSALLFGRAVAWPKTASPADLEAYVGAYRGPGDGSPTFLVRPSGAALLLFEVRETVQRYAGGLLIPMGDHRFSRSQGPEDLRFAAPVKGRSPSLALEAGAASTVLDRVEIPTAAWRGAAGEYRGNGAVQGVLRITETKGRFGLRVPGHWPAEVELVPATQTLALALYSEDFATLLRLDRAEPGRVLGFRWQRNDGQAVEGVRTPP